MNDIRQANRNLVKDMIADVVNVVGQLDRTYESKNFTKEEKQRLTDIKIGEIVNKYGTILDKITTGTAHVRKEGSVPSPINTRKP